MDTSKYNILIVEDEFVNAKFLEQVVSNEGYNVTSIVTNAKEAIQIIKKHKIDLVFMDINLDGSIDGIRCATLLNQCYEIPIIYISAYSDSLTIEEASQTNIYGYLIKPFDTSDVIATLRVAHKMAFHLKTTSNSTTQSSCIEFSNNYIYTFKTKTFTIDNQCVELTKKETLILHLFCLNINQNVSYDLLLEYVWKGHIVANSTIRDAMSRLRKKLPLLQFENIAGIGYRLIKV